MSQFTPSINYWHNPDTYRSVWTNKQWREYILETGLFTMACGSGYDWKSKAIGGGLREVWLEKKNYDK